MERERYEEIANPLVFKKAHKKRLCKILGKCCYCPWHGGENAEWPRDRSWKRFRKYKWTNIPTVQ